MTETDPLSSLATLDENTGKAPETRLVSATGARQRITEMREAESVRSLRRTKINGLVDGNRPYSIAKQKELNRGNETNINLRTSEGTIDAAKTPYYDLDFEIPRFLTVYCDYGDDPQRRYEWGEIISNELHNLFDDWDGYDANTQLLQWQMCVHGIGIAMFPDTLSWQWKSRAIGDVIVRDDAEANIDELDECCVPRTYFPTELYKLIQNKSLNWNVELARAAIIKSAPNDLRNRFNNNWELYQDSIRTGDVAWNNKSNRILVIDYLVKEYGQKITHAILLEDETVASQRNMAKSKTDFLFKKVDRFDAFCQVICPFFYDVTGMGLWHGVKGLGPKIFDFCSLENKLTGRLVDQAMAGIIAVPKTAEVLQRLETIPMGPVTWYPAGTEFQQTKLADSLEGPLMVKRDLQYTRAKNTGTYNQPTSDDQHAPTLGQDQMIAQDRAVLSKGAVNRYYRSKNRLLREMVRRAFNPKLSASDPGGKEAMEMIERCLEQGVPEEALKFDQICKVKAMRSIGYGSPVMREMISNKLISLAPTMDPRSARNAFRTAIAPFVGQQHADAFYPPYDQADVPNDQEWAARMENATLRTSSDPVGVARLVTPNQDHMTHFDEHLKDVAGDIQGVQSGQSEPHAVIRHLTNAGGHMHTHLNAMANDPSRKAQFEQRMKQLMALSKVHDQLAQQVAESDQAQSQAKPQIDPKVMAELMGVRLDAQVKHEKMLRDSVRKDQAQHFSQQIKDRTAAADIRRSNATAIAALPAPGANEPTPAELGAAA